MNPGVPAFGKKLFWFSKLANLKSMMKAFVLNLSALAMMLLGEICRWTIPRLWICWSPMMIGKMIFRAVV